MFKRVILIISVLISTQIQAHDSEPCSRELLPVPIRMNAYGELLAMWVAEANLLLTARPTFRPLIQPTIDAIVSLQLDLQRIRAANEIYHPGLIRVFESDLFRQQNAINATLALGEALMREVKTVRVDRGAQHPDRPMKREILNFYPMEGLEQWPYDFSADTSEHDPNAGNPGPVLPPAGIP